MVKHGDAAGPCPKCGEDTYWSDYWSDTFEQFCITCMSKRHSITVHQKISKNCTNCKLHKTRTNVVFGRGNLDPDLLVVGEAPGYHEDQTGKPFVGASGKLLDSWLARLDCTWYITNLVQCRPPNNRNPEEDELNSCREYLDAKIEILQPRLILAVGAFAARAMTEKFGTITSLRNDWHNNVRCTYHPAYILRNRSKESEVFKDLDAVNERLNQIRTAAAPSL